MGVSSVDGGNGIERDIQAAPGRRLWLPDEADNVMGSVSTGASACGRVPEWRDDQWLTLPKNRLLEF
jgi:hypothetical protein